MRPATELRQRWLETVPSMMKRAGMYASDGPQMETVARMFLENLCFLDERDEDFAAIRQTLGDRYGACGVPGAFAQVFGSGSRCVEEVASVYAEQFHRLGYLEVGGTLGESEWAALIDEARTWSGQRDVRRDEVEAAFGPPGLVVGLRVLCYVSTAGEWAFFDCWEETVRRYAPGKGCCEPVPGDGPLVRSVRVPAPDFRSGLVLTLFGAWVHRSA
ncbi:hypothetical protein ACBI99_39670 [Nonomuraea sp. ATR24]|uniref:hypothetical protein n=1 Tax=Nonomuraea sp. ATR24 TaxID=1676744 RepID=UPI0035C0D125